MKRYFLAVNPVAGRVPGCSRCVSVPQDLGFALNVLRSPPLLETAFSLPSLTSMFSVTPGLYGTQGFWLGTGSPFMLPHISGAQGGLTRIFMFFF